MYDFIPSTNRQHCILCSDDPEFVDNLTGYLSDLLAFWPAETSQEAFTRLEKRNHCIAIVDLHLDGAVPLITALARRKPGCLTIAIGSPQSFPFREASTQGIYAVFDSNAPSSSLQALIEQATRHLELIADNYALTQQVNELKNKIPALAINAGQHTLPFQKIPMIADVFGKLQRPFDVLDDALEELTTHFLSTSVGIFTLRGEDYALRAGLRCSEEAWQTAFSHNNVFVRWLKTHGQLISSKLLSNIEQTENRLVLAQTLEALGADIVIPITAHSSLLGWLFLGAKANGDSYDRNDHQKLLKVSDQVARILEGLIQFTENTKQQHILAGMADAVPSGLLLIDSNHTVSWANGEAKRILKLDNAKPGARKSIDSIHSGVADVARRASESNGRLVGVEYHDPNGFHLEITARHLETRGDEIGTMVLIEETPQRIGTQIIHQSPKDLQHPSNDLAFRIKNALSTIKSFSQLIAEKKGDPEFLASFSVLVDSEIETLLELSKKLPEHADV